MRKSAAASKLVCTALCLVVCSASFGHAAATNPAAPFVIAGPSAVVLGQSASFTATSTGSTLQWSVNGIPGGNAIVGSIQSTGVYLAPATMPAGGTVTISCTNANGQAASQVVALTKPSQGPAKPLVITGPSAVVLGQSASFTATSTGSTLQWSVNGIPGGNAIVGSIQSTGLYLAPATMPAGGTVTISCTNANGQAASQVVALTKPSQGPAKPLVITGPSAVVLGQSASFTATSTGSTLQWSVNGIPGGNAIVGSIQSTGLYLAPATMPAGGTVTISCTNANGQAASHVVALTKPSQGPAKPLVITGPSAVVLGQSASFTATSTGSTLQWRVNGVAGGSASVGYIQNSGMYQAPPNMPAAGTITISCADAIGLSSSLSITLKNASPSLSTAQVAQETSVSFTLTVTGSGFSTASVLFFNGKAIPILSASTSTITARVMASVLQSFPATVQIDNPSPGGGTSNIVQLAGGPTNPMATITAASRLLDQATFGPSLSDIQHVQSIGLQAYLNEQFSQAPSLIPSMPIYPNLADCRPFFQCFLNGWWFKYAMWGHDQLRQKVAFALSEQWVVSYITVPLPYFPPLLNVFANDAFGNWRTLMQDVTLSPAMGIFLDMVNSEKPTPTTQADQNYARELMQLFNLGPDRLNEDGSLQFDASGNVIPVYTPENIDAFARAFTGWTYGSVARTSPCTSTTRLRGIGGNLLAGANCPMTPVEAMHDTEEKVLLDGAVLPPGQSAEEDLNQALDNIFNDTNLPPFVAKQLIQHLVTSTPSPAYVNRIADIFVDNGTGIRGDMKAVINAILLDPEARADDVPGQISTNGGKLREPLLWMMSVVKSLNGQDASPNTLSSVGPILSFAASVGESVHDSADVFGYFSPNYLIPDSSVNAPEFELESSSSFPVEQSFLGELLGCYLNESVSIDCSATGKLGQLASLDPALLVEYLNIVMLHGSMSDQMKSTVVGTIQGDSPDAMVRIAVYLISTSPQYRVM